MSRRVFDWKQLLNDNRVEFIEKGPNVKRGEISIKCPMCGSADPSFHMGLDLTRGWWSCWRNKQHSGKSPVRLIMAVLGCTIQRACEIAGIDAEPDLNEFSGVKARLKALSGRPGAAVERKHKPIPWPAAWREIGARPASMRHYEYLHARGFGNVWTLINNYRLSFCPPGSPDYIARSGSAINWRDRILLPFVMHGEVVTWTGRAIAQSSARYIDQPPDDAVVAVKQTLYNHDALLGHGAVLLIVEGPFDVLKLDHYGKEVGVRAVGTSTASISEAQQHMLAEARDRFGRMIYMADQNAAGMGAVDAMRLKSTLAFIGGVEHMTPPYGRKDAGALTGREAIAFTNVLTTGEHSDSHV